MKELIVVTAAGAVVFLGCLRGQPSTELPVVLALAPLIFLRSLVMVWAWLRAGAVAWMAALYLLQAPFFLGGALLAQRLEHRYVAWHLMATAQRLQPLCTVLQEHRRAHGWFPASLAAAGLDEAAAALPGLSYEGHPEATSVSLRLTIDGGRLWLSVLADRWLIRWQRGRLDGYAGIDDGLRLTWVAE